MPRCWLCDKCERPLGNLYPKGACPSKSKNDISPLTEVECELYHEPTPEERKAHLVANNVKGQKISNKAWQFANDFASQVLSSKISLEDAIAYAFVEGVYYKDTEL